MLSAYKKILDNVVSKKGSRPIFKGVHYENGNAIATDSHQLVLFKDVVEDTSLNVTVDLSTYLPIDGNYPNVDQVVPTDHTTQLVFQLSDLNGVVAYLKNAKKQVVTMNIANSRITLKWYNNPSITFTQEVDQDGESLEVSFNANYLYNALAYLDQLNKEEQPLLYGKNVTINFGSELRPFTVEFGKMTYLICPVRLF